MQNQSRDRAGLGACLTNTWSWWIKEVTNKWWFNLYMCRWSHLRQCKKYGQTQLPLSVDQMRWRDNKSAITPWRLGIWKINRHMRCRHRRTSVPCFSVYGRTVMLSIATKQSRAENVDNASRTASISWTLIWLIITSANEGSWIVDIQLGTPLREGYIGLQSEGGCKSGERNTLQYMVVHCPPPHMCMHRPRQGIGAVKMLRCQWDDIYIWNGRMWRCPRGITSARKFKIPNRRKKRLTLCTIE